MYQGGVPLPPPLQSAATGGDCEVDPTLVGSGDCSSTIEGQFIQGNGSYHDYAELRFTTTVPDEAHALEFDFAFFSREYPVFYGREFNDMFVAWMESEWWTGNISFDDAGNPISLNAGFLDYRDAQAGTENDPDCVDGCVAPELHGTCMEGHAGTQWLTTSAPVQPGQPLMVVFAIFDLSDPNLDSYAFIDGVRWGCEGGPVVTEPAG
ncbi:MAG: choice-of-anchor L domain-containing protein [Myxococcota bacterium]